MQGRFVERSKRLTRATKSRWRRHFAIAKRVVLPFPGERTSQRNIGSAWQVAHAPRGHLGIARIEQSEEGVVIKIPASAGVISHRIDRAGNIVMSSQVTIVPLVQGIVLQEIGAG